MKKKPIIIFGTACLLAIGSFLAFGSSTSSDFTADQTLPKTPCVTQATKEIKRAPSKTAGFDTWIVDVQSNFDANSHFSDQGGLLHEYSAEVSITGSKAKIKGLFDLWYDEVDKEYTIEGSYDQRSGLITIPVGKYDSDKKGIDGYVKAAEMYSLSTNQPYTLVVFAGDMTPAGSLNTIDNLVFSVSEDMDRITAKSGFGLYAFDASGNPMAFYDYYKNCGFSLPVDGVKLSSVTSTIDFAGLFICTGMEQRSTVSILNRGSEATSLTVESSTPTVRINKTEATLASGERKNFEITILPTETGHLDENIYFRSDKGDDLVLNVNVDVYERPDYTLITKNGADLMEFEFSPVFPFVIAEREGKTVAVSINKSDAAYQMTEAWFTASVNVPNGKVGVLKYEATQINKQPNGFILSLDKEQVANYASACLDYAPFDVGGLLIIPEGKHVVGFSHMMQSDWFEYSGIHGEVYVSSLDFSIENASANSAVLDKESITFEDAYFDTLTTERRSSVKLYNTGTEALRVTGAEGTAGFSAEIPDQSVQHSSYVEIPLVWTVGEVGETTGKVTLHTTAGDFTIDCSGNAKPIPAEFHSIVTKGDVSFDTDASYPFIYNANRGYLYNSNSKIDWDGITNSWLDVTFEVPEGNIGKLYWDAYNDSEDEFYFNGVPSIVSGTTFTIDGDNSQSIGGLGIHCESSSIFTPGELIFSQGRHTVRFNYKKTFNDPERVFGDDRLKLFEISLDIIGGGDYKGYVTPESCDFKGIEYTVERDGHQAIGLVNYTDTPVELLSWDHEGPFSVVDLSEFQYEGTAPFMIEYHPTKTGSETGSVTLHTNIGDYTIPCSANGIDLKRGGRVYYESFEYGAEDWLFEDFDGDQLNWMEMSDVVNNFEYNFTAIPYGYRAMGNIFYDYGNTVTFFSNSVDNVMFSPEIEIPANGDSYLYFICAGKMYASTPLEVLVGVDADTYIDEYESVFSQNFSQVGTWSEYQVDLTRYAGKKIRLAFRMKAESCVNSYFGMVDDILITNSETPRNAGTSIVTADRGEVLSTEWYTPEGIRLAEPKEGVNIVVKRWSDGSVTSSKSIVTGK